MKARMARHPPFNEQWFCEDTEGPFWPRFQHLPAIAAFWKRDWSFHMESTFYWPIQLTASFIKKVWLSHTHANLLILLSMVTFTMYCDSLAVDRYLRGPKAQSLLSNSESIYWFCSSLKLGVCASQVLYPALLLINYCGLSKKRILVTTLRHYKFGLRVEKKAKSKNT